MPAVIGALVGIAFFVGLFFVIWGALAIVRGFVITKLWLWFVVPYFALKPLSIPLAIGLALLIGLFSGQPPSYKAKDKDGNMVLKLQPDISFVSSLLVPFVLLLLGWIVTFWLPAVPK